MSVYIITYELKNQDHKKQLDEAIRMYEGMELSSTAYAAVTEGEPDEIYATLRQYLGRDDKVLIMAVGEPFSGQAPPNVLEWLTTSLE